MPDDTTDAHLRPYLDHIDQQTAEIEQRLDAAVADIGNMITSRQPHMPTVPGVYAKIHQLMVAVDKLGRDGHHAAPGANFRYRSAESVMDAIGHAMRALGLIGRTEVLHSQFTSVNAGTTQAGNPKILLDYHITIRYVFVDPADGSTHAVEGVSMGRDTSDKAANKALTMATKYALLTALMIPFNDMPDEQSEQPDGQRQAAAQERDADDAYAERQQLIARAVEAAKNPSLSRAELVKARDWCARQSLLEAKVGDVALGKLFADAIAIHDAAGTG